MGLNGIIILDSSYTWAAEGYGPLKGDGQTVSGRFPNSNFCYK